MSNVAYYAIHYGVDEKGYIAFNKDNKEMTVVLPDETWQKRFGIICIRHRLLKKR